MENFTQEHINKYIEYVCIYRVKSGFKAISEIEEINKSEEEIRKLYHSNGGIQKWLADELNLTLEELGNLESNDKVISEKETIDKLFKNQFNNKRKDGFGNFKSFYEWYIKQENKCYYCDTSSDTLKILFDSEKLKSSKFNSTLHIEQLDPKKGYNEDNCRLSCSLCNNTKSDLISKDNYKKYFKDSMSNFLNDLKNNKIENKTF